MISLHYPTLLTQEYAQLGEHWIYLSDDSSVAISVKIDDEFLSEKRGIHGENYVDHLKGDGDIYYDPITPFVLKNDPTANTPARMTLLTTLGTIAAGRGLLKDSQLKIFQVMSAIPTLQFKCATWGDASRFEIMTLAYHTYSPTELPSNTTRDVYEQLSRTATTVTYKRTRTYWGACRTATNWHTAGIGTYAGYTGSGTVYKDIATFTVPIYKTREIPSDALLTPDDVTRSLKTLIAPQRSLLFSTKMEEKHYGTLAAEAIETKDYIHSNMISFISELRDPTSLIPKLKNLKNLRSLRGVKDVAGYYLSGKYGVLPTVSDLKEIVGAFNRVKPYIDKNGFSTFSAGYTDSMSFGNNTMVLEQRVKVALNNEERGLSRLTEGLESIGLMPNFTNIWDLVPYSFALDWFIGVGDMLEAADSDLRIATLDIKYVTMSNKKTLTSLYEPTSDLPLRGSVEWSIYHRWVTVLCPRPPLSLQVTGTVSNHWLEASALLIQRAKF